ncbi:MAG: protease pro-enzyme activation domain-containing protein [Terriglobales bacterium]
MIRRFSVYSLALVAVLATVSAVSEAAPQTFMTREARAAVVNGEAQMIGRMPASQTMHFDIVLALRHAPELKNFLEDIYDPTSKNFHQYLTPEEFTARFGPSQEDWDAVVKFAQESQFKIIGGSRDSMDIQLRGSVAQVEKAFHVQMGVYQHPTENRTFFAPDREPSVDLPFQLWHVTGLDNYALPHPLVMRASGPLGPQASIGSCPGASFCGSDMRAAYYGGTSLTGAGQNIGLLEYAGFDIADVNTYYTNAKETRAFAVTGISTDGSSVNCAEPSCDDTEQTLDITQAGGMAPNVTTVYVYVSDDSDTALLSAMSTDKPLPLNLSSSWTWSPADPSTDDPYFEKMGTQGQSFFQATGDSKAYRGNAPWPANSAYVTGVGGTDLVTQSAGGPWKSETAWVDGGGGWGTNVDIPSWQVAAVAGCSACNKTYRNVPDVSANANFTFYVCADQDGCTENEYGGTSFAAPMWAGYLALANQLAASTGAAAPGFINPAVYTIGLGSGYGAAFHDITSGSNGFSATTGYDLATGWGSPDGAGLINDLTSGGGGGGPEISFDPTSLKWGKVAVGTTASGKKKVVVTNSGNATLNITTIATTGDFALVAVKATKKVTPCVNGTALAPGSTCEIKVSFTPTQTGARTGDVNFTDNASGSPQSVALTGTGK